MERFVTASKYLRFARNHYNDGEDGRALHHLEQVASVAGDDPAIKAKILALLARVEAKRGSVVAADGLHGEVDRLNRLHPNGGCAGLIGRVSLHLDRGNRSRALELAGSGLEAFEDRFRVYREHLSAARKQLQSGASAVVPARPIRPSVVAVRIGRTFLNQGLLEDAVAFLERAIAINPRGASRARQILATISLRRGDLAEAEGYAKASLEVGKFQAKTVASWRLWIQARYRQGKSVLGSKLIDAVRGIQDPAVRARSIFEIVRAMRDIGDPDWWQPGQVGLRDEPIRQSRVGKELMLLRLVDLRLTQEDPQEAHDLAKRLLLHPDLRPRNLQAVAKVWFASAIRLDVAVQPGILLSRVEERWGRKVAGRVRHSLALSAMMERRHEIARRLLEANLARFSPNEKQWAVSLWATARMEAACGNMEAAARGYAAFARQESIPRRFRLLAFVHCVSLARDHSGIALPDRIEEAVESLVGEDPGFRESLDFARHLSDERFKAVQTRLIDHASVSAHRLLASPETDPSAKVAILLPLARRQYYDFQRYADLFDFYTRHIARDRRFETFSSADYFEYLSIVARAGLFTGRFSEGETLIRSILRRDDVAPEHKGVVAAPLAVACFRKGRRRRGRELASQVVGMRPTGRLVADVYYWLMVDALADERRSEAVAYALACRQCYGGKPIYAREWRIDARAAIVLWDDSDAASARDREAYGEDYMKRQQDALLRDVRRLAQ